MYLLFPEDLALMYITACCLYVLHFVAQQDGCDKVSSLPVYSLPMFCMCFPCSCCQKLGLSKAKEIQNTLPSK